MRMLRLADITRYGLVFRLRISRPGGGYNASRGLMHRGYCARGYKACGDKAADARLRIQGCGYKALLYYCCIAALLVRLTELLILAELVELVELDGSAELAELDGSAELVELVVDRPRDVTTVRWTARG